MKKDSVKELTIVAVFIALVVIGSRIYVGTHETFRFHLGNIMCLLAGLILNPLFAGLASGIGSMLFDLLFYPSGIGCIVTFFTKFIMGYVTAKIFNIFTRDRNNIDYKDDATVKGREIMYAIISGIGGEIIYILLYMLKTFIERKYVMGMDIKAVIPIMIPKFVTSVINAVIAIVISSLIYKRTDIIIKKIFNK